MIDRLLRIVRKKGAPECPALPEEARGEKGQRSGRESTRRPRGQRRLTKEQIEAGKHRQKVGGAWDEIGPLQLEFLKKRGLLPDHKLLDVGCGPLRGGLHFIGYLEAGNYYGIDIEPSLIEAGRWELERASLVQKGPRLLVSDRFEVSRFGVYFDYALAVSLFTHLNMNQIALCLKAVGEGLKPEGELYASFFEAPEPVYLRSLVHGPGGKETSYDSDPYHYSLAEMAWLARLVGLEAKLIGDWEHPRGQQMLRFRRNGEA